MIIENFDNTHNLHIGISILDAKLIAALIEEIPRTHYDKAVEELAKDNLIISVLDIICVVKQMLMSIKPYTNQLTFKVKLEEIDTSGDTVQ